MAALESWQQRSGSGWGPVFVGIDRWERLCGRMSGRTVARIVKEYVEMVGLDPAEYSGHSLRAGWTTDMLALSVPEPVVMAHTLHRDRSMLRVYYRPDGFLDGDLTARAGL